MKVKISKMREKLGVRETELILKKMGIPNRKRNSVTLLDFVEKLPVMHLHEPLSLFTENSQWFRLYLCQVTSGIKYELSKISDRYKDFAKVHSAAIDYAHGKLSDFDLLRVRSIANNHWGFTVEGLMYELVRSDYTREWHIESSIMNVSSVFIKYMRHEKEEELIKALKLSDVSQLNVLEKIVRDMNDLFAKRAEDLMKKELIYAATMLTNGFDPYPDLGD